MKKRLLACAASAVLVVAACPFSVWSASAAEGNAAAALTVQSASTEETDYFDYLNSIAGYSAATQSVSVEAAAFAADNGSGALVAENYEGAAGKAVVWKSHTGSLEWDVHVPQDGLYRLGFEYYNVPDRGNPIALDVKIDGEHLFPEMQTLELPRMYRDAGDVRKDGTGNEFAPQQEEAPGWYKAWLKDPEGLATEPYVFALQAGVHRLSVASTEEAVALKTIWLAPPESTASYAEVSAGYSGVAEYTGETLEIEGEKAVLKSGASLIAKADTSDPSVTPNDTFYTKVNYIGSTNWQQPGQTLSWTIDVPADGLYKLAFRFRQSYLLNGNAYRKLLIDGEPLFAEASEMSFSYDSSWQFATFSDADKKPYLLHLEQGKHTLTLEVTVGPMAEINHAMQGVVGELGTIYRKFVMVVGATPDANRDYNLFAQIPDLEERLLSAQKQLDETTAELEQMAGKRSGTSAVTLRNMSITIQMMLDNRYTVQNYKDEFYSNYCAVSSWLNEMKNMPLDIDQIFLASPQADFEDMMAGFFEKLGYTLQRFVGSFFFDYNNVSGASESEETITLWLGWGRDQVQALNSLAQRTFTPRTGIGVNIQIVNASLIQAILSGKGPDCSLMLSRAQPVNLAMRDALHDLTEFEDFPEVTQQFMPTACVPYEFEGGCYALPDSQQFSMMFYRTDILEELNIEVPETWDDLIEASNLLTRYNMQVGLPYTQITDIGQTDAGMGALNLFPTLLAQQNADLYTEDLAATDLTNAKAVELFTFWTDFYTKHKFPLSYDLYNRFRTGEIPIAISGYTLYSTLKVAAPEIDGRWAMALVPGFADEQGNVSHVESAGGTGAVILNISKHKKAAWEFLKWWTSADTQYSYSTEVESILGVTGRHATANVEALSRMTWQSNDLETLLQQWEQVEELPEIAGGYYVPRILDQAFWNTINNNEVPRDMLVKWSKYADEEITRKRQQYGVE